MVSVLVPIYNAEKFLDCCVKSLLSQTYRDLQVVLIDDGSKDNSWTMCQDYASRDARIEVYHQDNQGVAETRNQLLSKAKGDYLLFVDSDDWIEPDMVEYLVSLAIAYDSEMVMCDRVINDAKPSNKDSEVKILPQEVAIEDFLHHDYFVGALWNKLFKRTAINGIHFRKEIWYGEDALFTWAVLQNVSKVIVSDKQLYHFCMNDESISHQTFGYKKLTGHQTWAIISEETARLWPQYKTLSLGTFALQDMYLLQAAAQSGYPYNAEIRKLQGSVRGKLQYLKYSTIRGGKAWMYAFMISRFYGYGKFYMAMNTFKTKIFG